MPHLGEELWERLGYSGYLVDQPWPNADAALASDERAVLAVQVNGKKRDNITLPVDSAEDVARSAALAETAAQRAMDRQAGGNAGRKSGEEGTRVAVRIEHA